MIKKIMLIAIMGFMVMPFLEAQNTEQSADDEGRISITPMVSSQNVPAGAKRMLTTRMKQLLSLNDAAGDEDSPFFVMEANVDVLSKDVTATNPPMEALNLQVSFAIKDNNSGKVFSEVTSMVKGVGTNETKAYTSALSRINVRAGQYKAFVEKGKEKILEYYNSDCEFFLSKAKALKEQGSNAKAIEVLNSVPQVSRECYDRAMELLAQIEPPKEETAPASQSAPSGGGSGNKVGGSGRAEVEIDDHIFLVYKKMKTFGDKIVMYFNLENRGDKDYEFKDYLLDTRIIADEGKEVGIDKIELAGGRGNDATIMPGVPVKMECTFDKVDQVMMFEFPYKKRKFRLKDLAMDSPVSKPSTPASSSSSSSGSKSIGAIDYANVGKYEGAKVIFNKVTKWGKFRLPMNQFGNFSFDDPKVVQGKVIRFQFKTAPENNPAYLMKKAKPVLQERGFELLLTRDNDNLRSQDFRNGYMRKLDNQRFGLKKAVDPWNNNNTYMLLKGQNGGKEIYMSVYFMATDKGTYITQDVVEVE